MQRITREFLNLLQSYFKMVSEFVQRLRGTSLEANKLVKLKRKSDLGHLFIIIIIFKI